MPAIRDLKGRPIPEVVTSREVTNSSDTAGYLADRMAVQEAVAKVKAAKGTLTDAAAGVTVGRSPDWRESMGTSGPTVPPTVTVYLDKALPSDVEAGLKELETTLAAADDLVGQLKETLARVRVEVLTVRATVARDASRLQKLLDALKAIE